MTLDPIRSTQAAQDLFALLCAHRAAFQCAVESGTACEVITSTADSWDELVRMEDTVRRKHWDHGAMGWKRSRYLGCSMVRLCQVGVLQGGQFEV